MNTRIYKQMVIQEYLIQFCQFSSFHFIPVDAKQPCVHYAHVQEEYAN